MKRFLVHLEESQYETIRELAHQKRITMSEVIREAIDNYLEEGLGMKKQVNLADYNKFKEVDGYVWFTREDDPNENLILADDGYFLVDTSESDWQDWEDQWGFICENRNLWKQVKACEEGGVLVNGGLFDYDAVVNLMDDDLREELHLELAPCTNQEFVDAYIKRHAERFGEEFVIN